MYTYRAIKSIYDALRDDVSRMIFLKRLEYSISGRKEAIFEMVDAEIERGGSDDIMYRLLQWLERHSGKVTVFGAGFAGGQICSALRRHHIKIDNIADNNEELWGNIRGDIEVISPASIDRNNLVIIGVNSCVKEIFKQLISLGIGQERIFAPDKQWWIGATPQYFDPEILSPGMNEVFVDGGSLDGSDSFNFIEWCKGAYKAIYAFEPDGESLRKLYELAEKNKHMQVFEEGLWSEEAALSFSSGKAENCAVSADGDSVIRVTSIDKKLEGKKISFIKMDIEGSEMEALLGAADTIRKQRPKLAICVYHKPEDIIEIPEKILEMNPAYKLYLRHYSYVDTETVLYAV